MRATRRLPFQLVLHQFQLVLHFPLIAPLALDPHLIMFNIKQDTSSTIFWVFGMTQPEIEPQPLWPLANGLVLLLCANKWLMFNWIAKVRNFLFPRLVALRNLFIHLFMGEGKRNGLLLFLWVLAWNEMQMALLNKSVSYNDEIMFITFVDV